MGKDLKGKPLGVGICQRKDGLYTGRFVSKQTGRTVQKYFTKRYTILKGCDIMISTIGILPIKAENKNEKTEEAL